MGYYRDSAFDTMRYRTQGGTEFETDIISILSSVCKDKIKSCLNTPADKKEGTDLIYNQKIRIDITSNFSNKDNMPFVIDTNIPATTTQNFKMGIRHGNTYKGHTDFKHPVVVIGIDMPISDYRNWFSENILDNTKTYAKKLIRTAIGCYNSYVVTDPARRKEITIMPLEPNPTYEQHPYTVEKYQKLNSICQELNEREKENKQPERNRQYV